MSSFLFIQLGKKIKIKPFLINIIEIPAGDKK